MKRTSKEIMNGVDFDKKRTIANNTIEYWKDGIKKIRLHDTDILTFNNDGSMVLSSGGWLTVTTKNRISTYIRPFGWSLKQSKKIWYVNDFVFNDGIVLMPDMTVKNEGENPEKTLKLDKKIKVYCNKFIKQLAERKIEKPSAGDCFYCSMRTVDSNIPLGRAVKDKSHILKHIKENYFVPSLLMNAVKEFPVSVIANSELGYLLKYHESSYEWSLEIAIEQIGKSLLRYVRRELGIAS